MRFAEYALLLVPIGVLVAWFYGIRGLSLRGLAAFGVLIAAIGFALYFAGAARVFHGSYQPAKLEDGRVVRP